MQKNVTRSPAALGEAKDLAVEHDGLQSQRFDRLHDQREMFGLIVPLLGVELTRPSAFCAICPEPIMLDLVDTMTAAVNSKNERDSR